MQGKNVMITGATSGIGYELTKLFCKDGYSVILVGRNEKKLIETKEAMEKLNPSCEIHWICENLSKKQAALRIYEATREKGLQVDVLINNAGAGYAGEFIKEDEEKILEHIELNMTSLTLLTRYYSQEMKERGYGTILNVASTGSYHPGPYTSVYYACKSYVLSLSEALYEELKAYGIHVASLCPGATKTNFAASAGREDASIAMSAEFVAKCAYKGIQKRKRIIIPGWKNRFWICLPKKIAVPFIKNYQKKLMK